MSEKTNTEAETKQPVTKEKLRSIMEAASALTALGDEEDEGGAAKAETEKASKGDGEPTKDDPEENTDSVGAAKPAKRYLPDHKKPDAAPTFPEKLLQMMRYAEQQEKDFCIAWMDDGKSFVIRSPDIFTRNVVPKFFKATKFSSFTRKLYRWGFRQVNRGIGPDDPIIFGNEFFQRDNVELMAKMRSITAASARKSDNFATLKRSFESLDDASQKRMMLDHYMQQHQQKSAYVTPAPGPSYVDSLSLSNVLRPSMAGSMMGIAGSNGGGYDFMSMANYVPHGQHYANPGSTAEIVNAAIAALRFAT